MPLASKWLDLVVGLDLHLEIVPAVPSPVPFPHPFIGIIWDPKGYILGECFGAALSLAMLDLPSPSGPVLVNWMMGTVTGDDAKMPGPGHIVIPPGVSWAPVVRVPIPLSSKKLPVSLPMPPPADAMLLFGSQTVDFRGSRAVRVGEIALSCSDPVRLPTSVVIPTLPAPNIVEVGGPPAPDWFMLAMAVGLRAVRNKWTAKLAHGLIGNKPTRFRQFLHDAACFVTGHPVNVANGVMFTTWSDFELPGPIPLEFSRRYRSGFCDRDSPLGYGWSHSLDEQVWIEPHCVVYLTEDGRELEFDTFDLHEHVMRKGDGVYEPVHRLTLRSLGGFRWEIETHDGLVKEFGPIAGESPQERDRGRARLVRIRDRQGHEIRLEYDEQARLGRVIDSAGRRIQLEHGRHGRLERLWLPAPDGEGMRQHAHFMYSEDGDLVEARDAAGKPVRFEYDRHLMVRETDRNGLGFYFAYDGWGPLARCVRTWGDGGLLDHVLTYDQENRRTIVTDSLGFSTAYERNVFGLVTRVVDARGKDTRIEYDEHLRKTAEIDALGHGTRYRYDERGNQIAEIGPDGAVTKVQYDEHDAPVWLRTPKGGEWRWSYDRVGRLLAQVNPLGQATRYQYDERGRLRVIEDAVGRPTRLEHDGAGNVTEVIHPDGSRNQWRYDALGRVVAVIDARGNVQRRVVDAQGRIVRVAEPDGNVRVFEHDAEGNLLRARDRLREYRFTVFGIGRVASRTIGGTTVRLEYDTEQRLVAVVNEKGHAHRLDRDPTGKVRAEVGFDGVRRLYERDAAGRVTKVFRPGVKRWSTFEHDAAGRTTKIVHSDGTTERFAYDEDGELVEASNDEIEVRLERDALGRVVKEWQGEHWVESEHDHLGRRVGSRTSLGLRQALERNAMGDVVRHWAKQGGHAWEASVRRDELGFEIERLLPGGARSQWWRDPLGRPTMHLVGKGDEPSRQPVRGRTYRWGVDDRLEEIFDHGQGAQRFEHDARGYLVSTTYPNGAVDVRMPDEVGNLFRTRGMGDREYGAGGELRRMQTAEGVRTYAYDPEGNLAKRVDPDGGEWRYRWNGAGRLVEVQRPDGEVVRYAYDALGRRVSKEVGGRRRRRWVWDRNVLVHELDEGELPEEEARGPGETVEPSTGTPRGPPRAGLVTWIFEDGGFAPTARLTEAGVHSLVCDHRDAPLCMLDEQGMPRWQAHLDAWGAVSANGEGGLCPWRFAGQYEDEETGLCYNRFRYYDPVRGAYISQDPIGLLGGSGPYRYVDEPLVCGDPLGLTESGYIRPDKIVPSLRPDRAPGTSPHPFSGIPRRLHPEIFDIISDLQAARFGDTAAAARLATRSPHMLTRNLAGWMSLDIAGRGESLRFLYKQERGWIEWMVRDTHR
jgi:RHS repeat-associated protein